MYMNEHRLNISLFPVAVYVLDSLRNHHKVGKEWMLFKKKILHNKNKKTKEYSSIFVLCRIL